jgi:hypothetical protein
MMPHERGTSRRARESYAFRARFAWSLLGPLIVRILS